MKTLSEIKNEVAKQIGYESWKDYMEEIKGNFYEAERKDKIWEEVNKRFAEEVVKESIEVAACHADEGCFDKEGALANSLRILKENI